MSNRCSATWRSRWRNTLRGAALCFTLEPRGHSAELARGLQALRTMRLLACKKRSATDSP
jgi:hypothetical protein